MEGSGICNLHRVRMQVRGGPKLLENGEETTLLVPCLWDHMFCEGVSDELIRSASAD